MDKTEKNISVLEHIIKWCAEIPELHKEFNDSYDTFKAGGSYFKSVAMNLLQIGELINNLSKDFQEKYSHIPYAGIVSLRNVIAHGYGTLEAEKLWIISHKDTIELQKQCTNIISEMKISNRDDN